jgi:NADP-dependent 3-hydroxy acid dehydrogenase YdfG
VLERVAARVEQLQAAFGSAGIAIQGDVTHLTDNQHAVDATVRAFGQLDIFVGNAGIGTGSV